ncbi:MAG TPA: carbohydrate kinase [Armatimonadetes bacterium]|nr:carbohydrate kinase [Armatimonadota bacterium]
MPEVVCLGEALIDFVSLQSGVDLVGAEGFRKAAGGAPANVAAGVAKLGRSAGFVGKVGDDPFGRFLKKTLDECGVDTSRMILDPNFRTGLAFVSVTEEGERDFVFFRNPSADMMLSPQEVDVEYLESAKIFHFGSVLLASHPSREATLFAVERAREAGLLVSFDPNVRPPLWDSAARCRHEVLSAMRLCQVAKISDEEVEFLFGHGNVERGAEQILELGPELAVVTLGPKGAYFASRGGAKGHVPTPDVGVVDRTGAGDGFVAGLLVSLLEGGWKEPGSIGEGGLRQVVEFANAVGALTTTSRGAIPSLPTREAVDALLAKNKKGEVRKDARGEANRSANRGR